MLTRFDFEVDVCGEEVLLFALKEGRGEKREKGKERKEGKGKRDKKREQETEEKDQVILRLSCFIMTNHCKLDYGMLTLTRSTLW